MARACLHTSLEAVAFRRGHDGFLRGKPEPVLLVAAYAVTGQTSCRLLASAQQAVAVKGGYPTVTDVELGLLFRANLPRRGAGRLVVLCLGVEHDKGSDIARLSRELGRADAWGLWAARSPFNVPFTLPELALLKPFQPPEAMPVQAEVHGVDLREFCQKDDWVGGAATLLDATRADDQVWDFPLVSDDGRNHWTARIRLVLQR